MLTAAKCEELSGYEHLVVLCGHYEGVDERVVEREVDEEISIGDYVLTNGCAAAIVLIDALARFIPGVIGHPDAVQEDSFQEGIFDSPHYTRPENFEGMEVPAVLLGGNHAEIKEWRKNEAKKKTRRVRPDLLVGDHCEQLTSY
jgi:tRNA (guanine37-N1)-methyltransferase